MHNKNQKLIQNKSYGIMLGELLRAESNVEKISITLKDDRHLTGIFISFFDLKEGTLGEQEFYISRESESGVVFKVSDVFQITKIKVISS